MRQNIIHTLKQLNYPATPYIEELSDNNLIMSALSYILDKVYDSEKAYIAGSNKINQETKESGTTICIGLNTIKKICKGENVKIQSTILIPADDIMND